MCGLTVISSNWKLESSITAQSSGPIRSRSAISGLPMLPPTQVRRPAARHISPTSATVVVLPAEPVMPMTGAGHRSRNSCASLLS